MNFLAVVSSHLLPIPTLISVVGACCSVLSVKSESS